MGDTCAAINFWTPHLQTHCNNLPVPSSFCFCTNVEWTQVFARTWTVQISLWLFPNCPSVPCHALLPHAAGRPHSPGPYCLDADSATGFCTPKAVIKIFTTTIMNTSPVARLLRKFSFPCFAGLLRSYFTSKRKEKKMFNDMYIS